LNFSIRKNGDRAASTKNPIKFLRLAKDSLDHASQRVIPDQQTAVVLSRANVSYATDSHSFIALECRGNKIFKQSKILLLG
jgi:hypothetical protein